MTCLTVVMAAPKLDQDRSEPTLLERRDRSVRQIPPGPEDERGLDEDSSDDNESPANDGSLHYDADAGSIIGVSIGENQDLMKSPVTPAAAKAQALESSVNYFAAENAADDDYADEPSQPTPKKSSLSPDGDKRRHEKRTSLVGSLWASSMEKSRQRSSSASLLLDGIRKILPSMPSITQPNHSTTGKAEQRENRPKTLGTAGPAGAREGSTAEGASRAATSEDKAEHESTGSGVIRRVASEQSLYIARVPSGASQFDDYNNFANVNEMVNSRFKAITDSFQDSSLRMPKMPNISRGDRSSVASASVSDATATKTPGTNVGWSRGEMLQSAQAGERKSSSASSSSRHPIIKEALSQISGDLIIMGGYRGSILREAHAPHRQLWVPVKVGLNLRKADLEVGLNREDELKMEESIIPDGTLSHIGPVDICRRLLKKCRRCPNVKSGKLRIHDYGYDWRLSPDLLTDRLISFVESLPCNHEETEAGRRGVWVIAHSLGGLIIRSAINKRPELFAGVVYAGTPQNCVNILGPLRNGDDVLFSSRVLTAQVNFTLRTSYALLPQNGRCFINKTTGEQYDLDFFDVKTWEEYRLSPCIKPAYHRQKVEKRLSILGTTPTESTSSRSAKASGLWFGSCSKEETLRPNSDTRSKREKLRDEAHVAKNETASSAAETAAAATAHKPEGPLSPSLADGQNRPHQQQQKTSIATQVTIPLDAATAYLTRTLASVLAFKKSLSHQAELQARNAYPPVSVLFAKNTPTVYGAFVDSREAIKFDDAFDDLAFAAGDGVVLASAAQLPPGYRCVRGGRIESERGHVGLLGDMEGVGKCLLAVVEARRRGVGTELHDPSVAIASHDEKH